MFPKLLGRYSMATGELQTPQDFMADTDAALDDLLTVQETARLLKVSVSWIYEHVRPGAEDRLPVVKLGKYLRFDRRDLLAYIDAKRAASQRQPRRR
jgi:excisionase family DNA binding protein